MADRDNRDHSRIDSSVSKVSNSLPFMENMNASVEVKMHSNFGLRK